MKLFQSVGDYFALDIGVSAVRAVKLRGSGSSWELESCGSVPINAKVATSDAPEDRKKLSEAIATLIGQSGIDAKNVIVGIPSHKMFATVIDLPDMPKSDLDATLRYQSEQYIPMNLDESKVDWALLGKSPNDPAKNEILIVSVANSFSEDRLDLIESLGLNVVALEPDSLAIVRALVQPGTKGAQLIVNVGYSSTDIIATLDDNPRLIRALPVGLMTLTKSIEQRLSVDDKQAMQFLLKFGVVSDKLEGQLYHAVESILDQFAGELSKSITFFETRYPNIKVNSIVMAGYGETIPGFAQYVGTKSNLSTVASDPWAGIACKPDQQEKLRVDGSSYVIALGLAKRGYSV